MDEKRKKLFRELLYWGLAEIRLATGRTGLVLNPLKIFRRRENIRFAHEVAEWLHNLALFSAIDFEQFDESRFWTDYKLFCHKYPPEKRSTMFDRIVKQLTDNQTVGL